MVPRNSSTSYHTRNRYGCSLMCIWTYSTYVIPGIHIPASRPTGYTRLGTRRGRANMQHNTQFVSSVRVYCRCFRELRIGSFLQDIL